MMQIQYNYWNRAVPNSSIIKEQNIWRVKLEKKLLFVLLTRNIDRHDEALSIDRYCLGTPPR